MTPFSSYENIVHMSGEIPLVKQQPGQPTPQMPTPQAKSSDMSAIWKKLLANKSLALTSVVFVVSIAMTAYIIVAPSRDTKSNPIAYMAQSTPTPALIATIVPTSPNTSPTDTSTPTLTPTPTGTVETWKTYANSTYGYTIQYPTDWTYKDLGSLEPKVPSYVVFNMTTASGSARSISVGVSTRTYTDQLAIEGTGGTLVTFGGITGSKQNFKDSNGSQSISIILPRTNDLLMLRSKSPFITIFNSMISTLKVTTN